MNAAEWEAWARLLAMHLETVLGEETISKRTYDAADEALIDYQRAEKNQ